jgi:hypothetical protein
MKKLILTILVLSLFSFSSVSAWWNSDWEYRTEVQLDNVGNNDTLTDYQIPINISWQSGKMNVDFSDVRLVASDDSTELDYWFFENDYVNSSHVLTWVEVTIPADTFDTLYIYHGNPNATTTTSNGNTTFPKLFDDFNAYGEEDYGADGYLHYDTTKWTKRSSRPYAQSGTGGDYLRVYTNRVDNTVTGVRTKTSYFNITETPVTDLILETRIQSRQFPYNCVLDDNDPTGYFPACRGFEVGFIDSTDSQGYNGASIVDDGWLYDGGWFINPDNQQALRSNGIKDNDTFPINDDTWHDVQIYYRGEKSGGNIDLYLDGALNMTGVRANSGSNTYFELTVVAGGDTNGGNIETWYDYVFLREYTSDEPTYIMGSTEDYESSITATTISAGDIIEDAGVGTGNFLQAIKDPLTSMIVMVSIVMTFSMGIIFAIFKVIAGSLEAKRK